MTFDDLNEIALPIGAIIFSTYDNREMIIQEVIETDNQFGYGKYTYICISKDKKLALYRKEFTVIKFPPHESLSPSEQELFDVLRLSLEKDLEENEKKKAIDVCNASVLNNIKNIVQEHSHFHNFSFSPMDKEEVKERYRTYLSQYIENFDIDINDTVLTVSIPYRNPSELIDIFRNKDKCDGGVRK